MKILVIEADMAAGEFLHDGLVRANCSCAWVRQAHRGLELARKQRDDAILLGLPDGSDLATLEAIRRHGIRTPVIALTDNGAVENRVAALRAGADDCMVQPIALAELLARLEAVCRRKLDRPGNVLQAGKLTLDLSNRRLNCDQQGIVLTPIEFNLVELLFRYRGKVVSRQMLSEHVAPWRGHGTSNTIQVHMNRLRKKLRELRQSAIETVRGHGYILRSSLS